MTVEQQVRRFIVDELGWGGPEQSLTDDYGLITNHVIDSLGIYKLVTFLESKFEIEVRDEELVFENFGTIASVAKLVDSKKGS